MALDRLEACAPNVESVSLVVAWFGDDLRAGHCRIRPGVEVSAKADAGELVGRRRQPRLAHRQPRRAGPPGLRRHAVRRRRGAGDPGAEGPRLPRDLLSVHPDGRARRQRAAGPVLEPRERTGQPAYPWRGRITCSPAAGCAGIDKTAAAAARVAAFFGEAQPSDFDVDDETVGWDGDPDDWGLRRMILHYAQLCRGGVDAFLIGSGCAG